MGKAILAELMQTGESEYSTIKSMLAHLDDLESIFVLLSSDQKVVYINNAGCELLNSQYQTIVGKNWFDHYIPVTYRQEVKAGFVELMSGNISEFDTYINPVLTSTEREVNIRWDSSLVKNSEIGTIAGSFTTGKALLTPLKVAQDIEIFPESQTVVVAQKTIELPTSEFNLLEILAHRSGQVVRREFLARSLRGIDYDFGDRSLDMRISSLRKKLNDSKPPYKYIKTIRGVGYMLAAS